MANVISKGTLFPAELIPGLVQKTKGASALARLSGATPIAFNGQKEFTFSLDKEIDIVAENGAKSNGGGTIDSVTIMPLKVEYGMRVSDEFLYAQDEYRLNILEAFSEGFARKLAKGLDLMAFHGVNPRTGTASTLIGNNCFDKAVTASVTAGADADADVESAIALVQGNEEMVSGMIMAPKLKSDLAKLTGTNKQKLYPQLAWGAAPSEINGLRVETTTNLTAGSSKDLALVGDFATSFKWGYSRDMFMKVIEYGNPDNDATAGDLQGHNQVYLRCEAFLGWGILNPNAFALIKSGS